jgi:hypothetical protein
MVVYTIVLCKLHLSFAYLDASADLLFGGLKTGWRRRLPEL